ncbi:MAG: hypothetical protein R2828_29205 [Saprospiraceae bacterium]
MADFLELKMEGWTATPRQPFILSGNAICMATPSYSLLLGLIGCCLGRIVTKEEVGIGFYYEFDIAANDLEKRQRLIFDGKNIKTHGKGGDAYLREFHIKPKLTLWLNRLDWEEYFHFPVGTPSLGRSQDLLEIKKKSIRKISAKNVNTAKISGCMLPFEQGIQAGGQLVQLAEAYHENDEVGDGRRATNSKIFISIPSDNEGKISFRNLYETEAGQNFYFHNWD